jgi:flavin reductase (DIM6/NTAB) family NADH-FMN oxidoreductase RutF
MAKEIWKPGNMLYPIPAVMVTVADNQGNDNIITIAWTGTVCSDPALAYISVRPSRYSYRMIEESKEFVINLTTKDLAFATDYCGVKSGREVDKFAECHLTREKAKYVKAPLIAESPVNIECRVIEKREYGTHDMFVGEVLAVHADKQYMDETGRFDLSKADPLVYSHGMYYSTGEKLGKFGYSVQKNRKTTKQKKNKTSDSKNKKTSK